MDAFNQISPLIGMPGWGTNFLLLLNIVAAAGFLKFATANDWRNALPPRGLLVIQLFWVWSFITFLRGMVSAKDYWDWKVLLIGYLPTVVISLSVVLGVRYTFASKTIRSILFLVFPAAYLFIPFSLAENTELFSRLVMPVCLIILISPYLRKTLRIFVVAVAFTSIAMDFSYRANVLRILFASTLFVLFYLLPFIRTRLLNIGLIGAFLVPLLFLQLGVNDTFNVFRDNPLDFDANTVQQSSIGPSNLAADTRTFLYREVFNSMNNRESSFLIGEGGAAGYETNFFVDAVLNDSGRFRSEVGFLNTLLYSGVVGVLIYALVLFVPAYYAVNYSNNKLSKLLGLFIACRWAMSFVEDIAMFDMNYFTLWLSIGLCLSTSFRQMTEEQVKEFFQPLKVGNRLS
jgi:hypothetical protein